MPLPIQAVKRTRRIRHFTIAAGLLLLSFASFASVILFQTPAEAQSNQIATRPSDTTANPIITATPTLMPTFTPIPTTVPITMKKGVKTLLLTPKEQAADNASAPIWKMFPPQSSAVKYAIPLWWLTVECLGLVAFPLLFLAARGLRDRGWGIAKAVGMIFLGYLSWMLISVRLLDFTRSTIWLALGILAASSIVLYWFQRREIAAFLREHWRIVLISEAIFLAAYLVLTFTRSFDPSTWHPSLPSEKPMELAFTDGMLRSRTFPPEDPWFAGGYINYYYFGQYLFSMLIQITGINPMTAFNLMIPSLFALTATALFSVGYNLSGRWWVGGLSVWIGVLAGNLNAAGQLLHQVNTLLSRGVWPPFNYFSAIFVIPGTDNEFPNFSFQWGDLHPHIVDIAFEVASLCIVVAILLTPHPTSWRQRLPLLVIGTVMLGAMGITNTWDLPSYWVLMSAALILNEQQRLQHLYEGASWRKYVNRKNVLQVGAACAGMGIGSFALYLPYYLNYQDFYTGLRLNHHATPTTTPELLTIYALPLFVLSTLLLVDLYDRLANAKWLGESWSSRQVLILIGVVLVSLIAGLGSPVSLLLVVLAMTVWLGLDERHSPPKRLIYVLMALGFTLLITLEFVHIPDSADHTTQERFNTVFKFYEQLWSIFAVAAAVATWQIAQRFSGRETQQNHQEETTLPRVSATFVRNLQPTDMASKLRLGWVIVFFLILGAMTLYPIESVPAFAEQHTAAWNGVAQPKPVYAVPSLDGFAYMDTWYPGDAAAITWLNENVGGIPVITEAVSNALFVRDSRVSVYTGLPTIIGWEYENSVFRHNLPLLKQRQNDTSALYQEGNPSTVERIIQRYHVQYIYVGQLECLQYGTQDPNPDYPIQSNVDICAAHHDIVGPLAVFARMVTTGQLQVAYQNPDVTIYQVVD
jgi:YYY domain-containing protein